MRHFFLSPIRCGLVRLATLAAGCGLVVSAVSAQAKSFHPLPTPPPALPTGPVTASDASRLLTQATYGPTDVEVQRVQKVGIPRYLKEQFDVPPTSHVALLQQLGIDPTDRDHLAYLAPWWQYAATAPDQLRQRVAFALSEIMVASVTGPHEYSYGLSGYMDVLTRDCFGTFRQLLEDVTLSPEMGNFLNVLDNAVGNPNEGTHPNENYGREVMQLFTIGLNELNPDGSLLLDGYSNPIPTYTQDTVTDFARVFTGWTFAPPPGKTATFKDPANWTVPMVAVAAEHDTGSKTLLNGLVIPAGGTAQSDLAAALDNIASHPNVGPFFCRQLIQRLVTSNPSNGYVYRVAQVFANDGTGVSGNLQAVLTAILTDYEARSADWAAGPTFGKQREPVVRVANLLRAFNATSSLGYLLLDTGDDLGQSPLAAPSVFNFFSPSYTVPGEIAQSGLSAPEFQITSESTVTSTANYIHDLIYGGITYQGVPVVLDLSALESMSATPQAMTDYLNSLLMAGQMSANMQSVLTTAITAVPAKDSAERARSALEIVATSPEFSIEK